MRIAVEGCCHGELDKIYDTVTELEKQNGFKIDLLIICGDFQAVRNFDDLQAMAVPPKYQQLNTFYKYYSHEKVAPVLTVFIGGNHEASNYMQELPYGGWVAPNIYYMGYAGIIQIGGIRIGGISGIFKGHDFNKGHFERPPYADDAKRSVYHVRNLEVFRLKQITRPIDIFISHDWPRGIYHYGNVESLIRKKPFFQKEIEENKLGSGPLSGLLSHLQPGHWFAAHLHVKFAAHVQHQAKSEKEPARCTKFLALDKCLPRRNFLQVLELPHEQKEGFKIKLDPEWLAILHKTDHLLNLTSSNIYMPGPGCGQRFDFQVTDKEIEDMVKTFGGDMTLPENFVHTSPPIMGNPDVAARQRKQPLSVQVNPQTTLLCTMLVTTDPNAKFIGRTSQELLDDSSVGLDVDSGNDVSEEEDDADSELPSTIDSSLDVSASPGSTSLKWDSFCERNISLQRSQTLPLGRSTPAKDSLPSTPVSVQVDDNDDEFLSIMSAQKTKMSSQRHLDPSFLDADRHSPSFSHKDGIDNIVHSKELRVDQASGEVCNDTVMKTDISCERVHATSPCQLSSNSNESTNVSSCDNQQPSLNLKRTSLGMSGLCLHSAETSPSLSKTGDSFSQSETEDVSVTPENGSSVKKLKRRNVSLYSEPLL